MIEAYAIGVNLTLRGNIGNELAAVARQFENLNKIIAQTKGAINELGSGMGAVARQARSAAQGWQNAASQMRAAAREAKQAAEAMARVATPPAAGSYGPATAVGTAPSPAPTQPSNMLRIAPPAMPLLLPAPRTDFTMWNDPSLPTGGGSRPRMGPSLPPTGNSGGPGAGALAVPGGTGTFAGGPGSPYTPGLPAVVPGGGAGGNGGGGRNIPLNFGPATPQMPKINQADAFVGAQGFGVLGDLLIGITSKAVHASADIDETFTKLRLQAGLSDAEVADAKAMALRVQRHTPGVSAGGAAEVMLDLYTTTQKKEDAVNEQLITKYAQLGAVLRAYGRTDTVQELFKAMQSAELRGAFSGPDGKPDPRKAAAFMDNVMYSTVQTGGRYGPAEILQLQRSGGLGSRMMGDRELFVDSIVPALSMRAANAGNGIQGFAAQFAAGKMSDAAVAMMAEMKLFNAGWEKHLTKIGMGQWRLDPEYVRGVGDDKVDPARHPYEYMSEILLPAIEAYNQRHFGQPKDEEERKARTQETAQALTSRIPGGKLLGDVAANWGLFIREREARDRLEGRHQGEGNDVYSDFMRTSPNARMIALSEAMNGLFVVLGGSIMDKAIDGIRTLTSGLNTLSEFMEKHGAATSKIMEYGFKIGALSVGVGMLGTALAIIPSMARLTGMAWGILSFGTALSGLPMSTLATLPGAMRAFGAAAVALRAALLVGAGVGLYQMLKDKLTGGADMHKFMLEHLPGAQWLNRTMNHITGGALGDSEEDMHRQYPDLNTGGGSHAPERSPGTQRPDGTQHHLAPVPPSQNPFLNPASYRPPPVNLDQKLEIHVQGQIDGRTLLSFVSEKMLRAGSGPSGGSTGFDARTVYTGSMQAA